MTDKLDSALDKRRAQNRRAQKNYRKSMRQRLGALEEINRALLRISSNCFCQQNAIDWPAVQSILAQPNASYSAASHTAVLSLLQAGQPNPVLTGSTDPSNPLDPHIATPASWTSIPPDEDLQNNNGFDPYPPPPEPGEPPWPTLTPIQDPTPAPSLPSLTPSLPNSPHSPATAVTDRTPLHQATQHAQLTTARLLLDHGADVAALDSARRTPLHLCAETGNAQLAALLVRYGADVAACDARGRTPLHVAATGGFVGLVQVLVGAGADVNALCA